MVNLTSYNGYDQQDDNMTMLCNRDYGRGAAVLLRLRRCPAAPRSRVGARVVVACGHN